MSFSQKYPEFASIEGHIRQARKERAFAIAMFLSDAILAIGRGIKRLAGSMGSGLVAERERRAIEADAFLKRSVPKY